MDKQNVIYTYNAILFIYKKREILTHVTLWLNLENILLSEINYAKKLYDSSYMR